MAKDLGMRFKPKLNWASKYSPVKNKEFVKLESGMGVSSRKEYKEETRGKFYSPCHQLWVSPQINWNGKLLGCCVNRFSDFGNVFENGLKASLKSEKYIYAKKMLLGKVKAREDIPCYNCNHYWNREGVENFGVSDSVINVER